MQLNFPFLFYSFLYEPDLEGAGQTEGFAVAGHVARRGFLHFVHVTCYFTRITFESQFFVLIHAFAVCKIYRIVITFSTGLASFQIFFKRWRHHDL